jgi:hypothetical protein
MLWMALVGCASMMGLEELEAVPADFPLTIGTDIGHVTTLGDKQVAVDLVFRTEEDARAGWDVLSAEAAAKGFAAGETGRRKKREFRTFEGEAGKLELGCCLRRADKQWLVFATWWKR